MKKKYVYLHVSKDRALINKSYEEYFGNWSNRTDRFGTQDIHKELEAAISDYF